jgi:sulfite exporter TauE/SafE
MTTEIYVLMGSAAALGFVHTLAGPDHYLPFVALKESRRWSMRKTLLVTSLCGVGHTGSAVLLGILGVSLGWSLQQLTWFDGLRGDWAAWLLFLFGLGYCCWGLYRSWKHPRVSLVLQQNEAEGDAQAATAHSPLHPTDEQAHNPFPHSITKRLFSRKGLKGATPWILFLIFVLGPCEPLIPLLLYPAVAVSWLSLGLISLVFMLTTILTMLIAVSLLAQGISLSPRLRFTPYVHAAAGFIIALCGAGILFLGL